MNTLLIFGNATMLGQFKTALEITAPQTLADSAVEHDAARKLYRRLSFFARFTLKGPFGG